MDTTAIVFERPGRLDLRRLTLCAAGDADIVVETIASGVSTGTEKLLFTGAMPPFPGLGYPLVPGYESVARVVTAGPQSGHAPDDLVFVPGASCFEGAAGLFGASADRLVLPGRRAIRVDAALGEDAVLLALAATAHNAVERAGRPVDLVVGHGVLGRLIARLVVALGDAAPTVWETAPGRRSGGEGYRVIDPADDRGTPYHAAIDASGSVAALDAVIARLARHATMVLAGFYSERVAFDFAPAFMREISIAIAAEFRPEDVRAVLDLVGDGRLSLKGLITHRAPPQAARAAYQTAFDDPACLKMVIDWRNAS